MSPEHFSGTCAEHEAERDCPVHGPLPLPVLVVAAFWAESGHGKDLLSLVDHRIRDSGSVVTLTRTQTEQRGLWAALRKFDLTEAEQWGRS